MIHFPQMTWRDYYEKVLNEVDPRRKYGCRCPWKPRLEVFRDWRPDWCRWTWCSCPFEPRLEVIRVVRKLFATYPHFKDIPQDGRKKIAGLVTVNGIDFGWFGHMGAAGYFKGFINNNAKYARELDCISRALDCIPTAVSVAISKREHFDPYVKNLPHPGLSLKTASRLLAMKRPDTFVCLTKANMEKLCDAFGVRNNFGSDWAEK